MHHIYPRYRSRIFSVKRLNRYASNDYGAICLQSISSGRLSNKWVRVADNSVVRSLSGEWFWKVWVVRN